MIPAQVLTWSPLFSTRDDTIMIIYDATLGNGGLVGASEVYAHTGVITDKSSSPTHWRYVKTEWGQNTPDTKLTSLGNDRWQMRYHIESYYGVPDTETIEQLAFVFRNASSTKAGRAADGSNLYIPVYQEGLQVTLISPVDTPVFSEIGDQLYIQAVGNFTVRMVLCVDDRIVVEVDDDTLDHTLTADSPGRREITLVAFDSTDARAETSIDWLVNPKVVMSHLPAGIEDGINSTGPMEVTLSLHAPDKKFVYVIGSFNDWKCTLDGFMNLTPDSSCWWLTLTNLNPDSLYQFQYFVDGEIKIADPYSELVLDPWNDQYIPESIFPDLPRYPLGKTTEIVGTFKISTDSFNWTDENYIRPAKTDLIIYELLIRDFLENHDYETLIDTLSYFQDLGINAIELMPVNEFEGNSSWGYNPSFYFAPDKYYGPARDLKRFVNEAHSRDIAVFMDMVLNHAYGQCSLVRLYWDSQKNRPSADNPWFNQISPNPVYNWGYDFNHQSTATQNFVDRVLSHWIEEYHIDGYRLDFTKGFTNTYGDGGAYDSQRIQILKRLADNVWSADSTVYIILEHFADDREEKNLANYGMMLWNNMNTAYSQSAMGWLKDSQRSSDLSACYYKNHGWSVPGLVTYMESHDEPWLMYKNLQYGRIEGNYNIQELSTALERYALAASFFLTIPGPKMLWQFGELGYDEYLPESGIERTAPKPLHWEYFQNQDRRRLYDIIAALCRLRQKYKLFSSADTDLNIQAGQGKYSRWLHLSNDTMKATVLGNFDVKMRSLQPIFQNTGTWYEYFSGDSINVYRTDMSITMQPGEYRIYLDTPAEKPFLTGIEETKSFFQDSKVRECILYPNYPNPFNNQTVVSFNLEKSSHVQLNILNLQGQIVDCVLDCNLSPGFHKVCWETTDSKENMLSSGIYIIRMKAGDTVKTEKILLIQ
ncbi:MAG: alpha-amylase family glycosyl hydrolase [bacterium]